MNNPSSLRDLYSTNPSTWTFSPPSNSTSSPSSAPISSPPSSISSHTFSSRPVQNSIFELSPSLAEPGGLDLGLLLKTLVASAILEYTTTAIAMPWEVGKCLLQVQWIPRDAGQGDDGELATEEVTEEVSDDESGEESYFADPLNPGPSRYPLPRPADERGYVVRKNVMEESTRPDYVIPVGSADGVWAMMKRLGRFRGEGWLALWKGLLTECISDMLSSTMQPLIHNALQNLFTPNLASLHISPGSYTALLIPVASHLITGFILSPLDLVRTRLIVQSFNPQHRTYTGPIDALQKITRDEGGLRGLYLHPHLLIPTVLDNIIRPLISLGLPPLLAARLFPGTLVSIENSPVAWGVVEFASSCIGLLATLPFETVRRRLQVQVRGRAQPLKTCVEKRPIPYNGVVDALWHILTEERSDLPVERVVTGRNEEKGKEGQGEVVEGRTRSRGQREEHVSIWRKTGLGQLYRGLSMRLGAGAIVFVLGVLTGGGDESGWAEL
ncbi:mitochondrial carrier [Multifurca ochricompacta]|uniref:Mitochondrial carrier n=1 Tax=Multifurca ochricompacta TaxID=376703 RepID=A0AAD4QU51_9AGAM|nr:mitochondrial carrier [Multifurca ochricompacta]